MSSGSSSAPASFPRRTASGRSPTGRNTPRRSPTIEQELDALPAAADPARAVYVLHGPPSGKGLDRIRGGGHAGSAATLAFLTRVQPLLSLHGHIHESPEESDVWMTRRWGARCASSPANPPRSSWSWSVGSTACPSSGRSFPVGSGVMRKRNARRGRLPAAPLPRARRASRFPSSRPSPAGRPRRRARFPSGRGSSITGRPAPPWRRSPRSFRGFPHHRYVPDAGLPELRKAFEEKLRAENGIDAPFERRILVTAGANQAFLNAVLAVCDPGDEVILPVPYYFNHEMAVRLASAVPIAVPTDDRLQPDPAAIEAAITKKTRAVVTVSPNNPTGAVYGRRRSPRSTGCAETAGSTTSATRHTNTSPTTGRSTSPPPPSAAAIRSPCSAFPSPTGWRAGASGSSRPRSRCTTT